MIENAVMKLLQDKLWYANFILNMRRIYTDKIPTAAVSVTDKVNLYINTEFWNTLTLDKQVAILEHEAGHVFNAHCIRAEDKNLDYGKSKNWNIACDIVVNQPIKELHDVGVTYDKLKKEVPTALSNETADYYYELINKIAEEKSEELGEGCVDDHSTWSEGDDLVSEEMQKEVVKSTIKKATEQSGGIGNCPHEVQTALQKLNKSTVNWKQQLKQFMSRAEQSIRTTTRKKRNRRYGVVFPGNKKSPKLKIAIVNDESGSVSNLEYSQFYAEIDKIKALYADNIELQVIHCDTQVNRVYEYKKGMEIVRTGHGGTDLTSGMKKAVDLACDGIVMFSDGEIWGDQYEKPKCPVLWAIVRNPDIEVPFGRKIYVKTEE